MTDGIGKPLHQSQASLQATDYPHPFSQSEASLQPLITTPCDYQFVVLLLDLKTMLEV